MDARFVHLRLHSAYSLSEGAIFVKKIPDLCQKMGMPAIAITDTNALFGAPLFSVECKKNKIQPIIGITISFNQHDVSVTNNLRQNQLSKIVLLTMNEDGFQNLSKLITDAYLRIDNLHLGPYITFDELATNNSGLICLSGGVNGPIGMALLNNQPDLARDFSKRFADMFSDRFYMEIQRHATDDEIKTESDFLDLAYDLNIPVVATNDVYFPNVDAFEAHDALLCIAAGTKVIDPDRRRETPEHYFKSVDEMCELFSDLPEAINNTVNIAKRCTYVVPNRPPLLPKFAESFDREIEILREKTMTGLIGRLNAEKIPQDERQQYFDQAEFELSVIIRMKFPGYFLIVADFIQWSKDNDILVGPGRGSGAGSVVAWSLNITNVNPLRYGLLFERFLNPDRISMPDFDIDFDPDGRDRVVDYVQKKYGTDRVSQIITFGSLLSRGTIRDVGRVFGMPYGKMDRLAKLIPSGPGAPGLRDAIDQSIDIQEMLDADSDLKKVAEISTQLEGLFRHAGVHAAGVIIGDRPLVELAPLYKDPSNELPATQYDLKFVEDVGLIKFDFLGLKTLSVIKKACSLIAESRGIKIDIDKIPLDDSETFKLLKFGKTVGVFQLESSGMRQVLAQMQPTLFEEIVAVVALYRPGPMASIPDYIERKHGRSKVEYVHPLAEPALKETYGVIVYQEQVMEISKRLAGFTPGMADTLRKAMGKKIKAVMDDLRVKFVEGCQTNSGMTETDSNHLYDVFVKFAEYAFNKSHSVCYAVISMQTAYLKANFPAEFFAASMSYDLADSDKLALFIDDATSNFRLEIVAPDINKSGARFRVRDNKILYALAAIKGIGVSAVIPIVRERDENGSFKNITDFATRCSGMLNKRVLEALIKAGAMDSLCRDRALLYQNMDAIIGFADKNKSKCGKQISLFEMTDADDVGDDRLMLNLPRTTPWTFGERLKHEHSVLGFYISAHPLDQYRELMDRDGLACSTMLKQKADGSIVRIAMCVDNVNKRTTRAGKPMVIVTGSDHVGSIDAVAFGFSVDTVYKTATSESAIVLTAKVSQRDDSTSLMVNAIQPLSEWVASSAHKIVLDVHNQNALADLKMVLDNLPSGLTKIHMNLYSNGKVTSIILPRSVQLDGASILKLNELVTRVSIT